MNTIIVENAKAAALFAQATNSNDLGFRQYRGNRIIITWTDGIPLNKEVTVRDKSDVHIQLSDALSRLFLKLLRTWSKVCVLVTEKLI